MFSNRSDKTRRASLLMCAALAGLGITGAASAATTLRSQNFNIDPGWLREGDPDDNMDPLPLPGGGTASPHPSHYGFSDTDITGTTPNPPGGVATANGEGGGTIGAERPSSYADNIGGIINPLTEALTMKGVFNVQTNSQETCIGWFDSTHPGSTTATSAFAHPALFGIRQRSRSGSVPVPQSIAVYSAANDSTTIRTTTAFNGDAASGSKVLTGTTYAFEFTWNPTGGAAGLGAMTLFIDGVDSNDATPTDHTFTTEFTQAQHDLLVAANLQLDRFGLTYAIIKPDGAGPEQIFVDDLTYSVPSAVVSASQWNVDSNGSWSVASNWTPGVPNSVGATANFGTIITAARTVTVDSPQTVGVINFSSPISYTIAGTSTLTLDGSATINVTAGSHTISAPILMADDLAVNVVAGQTLSVQHFRKAATAGLSVNSGTVKILAGGTPNSPAGTSVVSSLAIAAGAVLDLTNNSAIIDYTGAVGTQVSDVRQHLSSGRLTSSSATSLLGLGYGDNAVLAKASFGGQTVDSSSILVKYTYLGDANLDGQVDVADLGNLASSWQSAGVWTNGDFDYNNFVDVNDLGKLASNWQAGVGSPIGPGLADALAALGLPATAVPEPASMALLLATGVLGLRARRKI